MKVKFHYNNLIYFDVSTDKNVDVYIDQIERSPISRDNIRIVILEEPRKGHLYKLVKNNSRYYTFLLTFHEQLLHNNKRARRFLFINTWVRNYVSNNKHFAISTVVGGKNHPSMSGYELRHELWRHRELIKIPREFYLSGSAKHSHTFVPWDEADYNGELILGASKEPMFDSMFHVCIENTPIANYFTEKITDCFQSRTVPIYCGCTNIGEFFNPEGILIARNLEEIVTLCNSVTTEMYERMIPAMEDNFERSKLWIDPKEQVERGISKLLSEL